MGCILKHPATTTKGEQRPWKCKVMYSSFSWVETASALRRKRFMSLGLMKGQISGKKHGRFLRVPHWQYKISNHLFWVELDQENCREKRSLDCHAAWKLGREFQVCSFGESSSSGMNWSVVQLLLNHPSSMHLLESPIDAHWFTKLDIGAVVIFFCFVFPFWGELCCFAPGNICHTILATQMGIQQN